jgi:hypothetical protein
MVSGMKAASRLGLLVVLAACNGSAEAGAPAGAAPAAAADSSNATARRDVESTTAAALAHFREPLTEPAGFEGAAPTREALVERYVRALEAADTAAFAPMMITRAEYAWLYYPFTKYTRPPYAMEPDVLWLLLVQNAEKGIVRALREYGGRSLGYAGHSCNDENVMVGENRLWNACGVKLRRDGETIEVRLFGTIVERDARFKFLSYSNDL